MKYIFLSAFRNESLVLEKFLEEFVEMTRRAGISEQAVLYLVDDLSTDDSRAIIESFRPKGHPCEINILSVPTNLGNQGAMHYGICRVDCGPGDVLITLDCDGEDDVGAAPSIIDLGRRHPEKIVLIERGWRSDSTAFKTFFFFYRFLFRVLTGRRVVPNNYMLIPGCYVEMIRRSPLVAAHLANGVLRLNLPSLVASRDRRPRYGGTTTQNFCMLMTHGLVGIMMFYEVVVSKVLALVLGLAVFQTAVGVLPVFSDASRARVLLVGTGVSITAMAFLVSATAALILKLVAYRSAVNPRSSE